MSILSLRMPLAAPLLNTWQRMHWRMRKRHMEAMTWEILRAARDAGWVRGAPPIQECCIQIDRLVAKGPYPDWDGLMASGKPILDALVRNSTKNPHGLGIIEDDNPTVVKAYSCWAGRPPGKDTPHCTFIRIYTGARMVNEYIDDYLEKLDNRVW